MAKPKQVKAKPRVPESVKDPPILDPHQGTPSNVMHMSGIPHGFYEQEIAGFFSQFGTLSRVRIARNRVSGRSKGYGFVEFKHANVAKIAAEAMNDYLLLEKKLRCHICSEEWVAARPNLFRGWNELIDPEEQRKKILWRHNRPNNNEAYCVRVHELVEQDRKKRVYLAEKGIIYDYPRVEDLIPEDSPYHTWLKLKIANESQAAKAEQSVLHPKPVQKKRKLDSASTGTIGLMNEELSEDEECEEEEEVESGLETADDSLSSVSESDESLQAPQTKDLRDESVSLKEWVTTKDGIPGPGRVYDSDGECEIRSTSQPDAPPKSKKSEFKGFKTRLKKNKKAKMK